ncbi:MAG: hypothetical protein AAFN70_07910, partial [Planctomycetota bacterium]
EFQADALESDASLPAVIPPRSQRQGFETMGNLAAVVLARYDMLARRRAERRRRYAATAQ